MPETLLLKQIIEAALLAADQPLSVESIRKLFTDDEKPEASDIKNALDEMITDCQSRGFEIKKVASGYRMQVKQELSQWISRLWEEKPPRYSRALLETLALIAYKQPVTRGDIEEIRGVAVSSTIIKTLLEHEWIKCVGHREVPGRPALYATTKYFLDYFNLKSLNELPTLNEIKDLDSINPELPLEESQELQSSQENEMESEDISKDNQKTENENKSENDALINEQNDEIADSEENLDEFDQQNDNVEQKQNDADVTQKDQVKTLQSILTKHTAMSEMSEESQNINDDSELASEKYS